MEPAGTDQIPHQEGQPAQRRPRVGLGRQGQQILRLDRTPGPRRHASQMFRPVRADSAVCIDNDHDIGRQLGQMCDAERQRIAFAVP